jgi:hypothetical protein
MFNYPASSELEEGNRYFTLFLLKKFGPNLSFIYSIAIVIDTFLSEILYCIVQCLEKYLNPPYLRHINVPMI